MALYCLSKYKERKSRDDIYTKDQLGEPKIKEVTEIKEPPVKFKNNVSKAASNFASDAKEEQNLNLPTTASSNVVSDAKDGKKLDSPMTVAPGMVTRKQKEHVIDVDKADDFVKEQHPPQVVAKHAEKIIVNPSVRTRRGRAPSVGKADLITTVKSFSIVSLQQYNNSFSEENFIRDSKFGKVYLAELPDGEVQISCRPYV